MLFSERIEGPNYQREFMYVERCQINRQSTHQIASIILSIDDELNYSKDNRRQKRDGQDTPHRVP